MCYIVFRYEKTHLQSTSNSHHHSGIDWFSCDVRDLTRDEFVELFLDYMRGRVNKIGLRHQILLVYC